jgi:hypothetical protein
MVALGLAGDPAPALAQSGGSVQVLTGQVEPGRGAFYDLPRLRQGQTLYVYAEGTSGNLDPFAGVGGAELDGTTLRDDFYAEVDRAIDGGQDPLAAIPEIVDQFLLAWDDDSGTGYAAALTFPVPADGNYQLLVTSNPAYQTFGEYRLTVGLDAPDVLTGEAEPTGDTIAVLDLAASRPRASVQELTGSLTADRRDTFYTLEDVRAGDTLHVFVEATSGDLAPIVYLNDFGGKPLRSGNYLGQESRAFFEYTFPEDATKTVLNVSACCEDGPVTTGDYRLLVGLNSPQVLTGRAASTGEPVLRQPAEVKVGVRVDQIIDVDQAAENFSVVARLRMEWQDRDLAFSPDTCQCQFKALTGDDFVEFASVNDILWPEFTLFNQQERRFAQNQLVTVRPAGEAMYFERFSATLDATEFDFRRFPFDTQEFQIHVVSLLSEEFYTYADLEGFSVVDEQATEEEEWIVTGSDTQISSVGTSPRFTFRIHAGRHLTFYIWRIFTPLVLIIFVGWLTFFIQDYEKQVDVSAANLLLFIAFNFTIADNLPRLGYLTFLDSILVSAFLVSVLAVVLNVVLKRLDDGGKAAVAQRVERLLIWLYPLAYVVAIGIAILIFF